MPHRSRKESKALLKLTSERKFKTFDILNASRFFRSKGNHFCANV